MRHAARHVVFLSNHDEGAPVNEYLAGMGTTPGMWKMLSDILAENQEKLPDSLNHAIYALRDGAAMVAPKHPTPPMVQAAVVADPLGCDVPDDDVPMIYGRIWAAMLHESAATR